MPDWLMDEHSAWEVCEFFVFQLLGESRIHRSSPKLWHRSTPAILPSPSHLFSTRSFSPNLAAPHPVDQALNVLVGQPFQALLKLLSISKCPSITPAPHAPS